MSSYNIDALQMTTVYLYKYILPILYIFGNIGNFLSALIFAKKSWRKNVCVFYFNCILILNTICINSYMLGSIFITGYNINLQNSSVFLCKLYSYVAFFSTTDLPAILICASIDRVLISSENIQLRLYSSKRLAYFSVSLSTFIWLVFFFHILIKVNIQQFNTSYVCFYDYTKTYLEFVSYSSLIITSLFSFTMTILLIFVYKNVRRMQSIPRQQRQRIRSMNRKDFQLLSCLLVQDIVYIGSNIFLNIYYVYIVARMNQRKSILEQAISDFLEKFLIFFQLIPSCASFYIFMMVSKTFRMEMKRMFYKIIRRQLIATRGEEDNKQQNIEQDNVELNIAVDNIVVSA